MEDSHMYTIHIGSARVVIATKIPSSEYVTLGVDDELSILRAKVIKKVETDKFIAILTPEPDVTFRRLAEQFVVVEAAGGVVENAAGELLMIRLRGRWDLPKGHIEVGENGREAALREVVEETGVMAQSVGGEALATTWHAYDTYGRWELKRTQWWRMQAIGGELKAQSEEGIAEVRWCSRAEVEECMKNTYETIKRVVAALDVKTKL